MFVNSGKFASHKIMQKSNYIPTLDGWRAIAIGIVIVFHAGPILDKLENPTLSKLSHFIFNASYGVDIFFALSGCLICTLLLEEKQRLNGRVDLGRFYTRRVFRILPPLVAYLALLVILHATGQILLVSNNELISSLGFFRNYSYGHVYTQHFWSLAIEEHFYLIMPLLLSCLRWRTALVVAVGLSLASSSWRWIEYRYEFVQEALPWTVMQFRTENRFDGLMNGAILALLLHRPRIRDWFTKILSPGVVIGLLLITLLSVTILPSPPARRTTTALMFPLFIAFTVLRPKTLASNLLELPALRWIGRISYSLYVWQQLFLIPDYISLSPPPLGYLQRSFLSIIPVFGCALTSFYFIEKPMIRLGHYLASSPGSKSKSEQPESTPTIAFPNL